MDSNVHRLHRRRPAQPQKEAPAWFKWFMGIFLAALFLLLCTMLILVLALGVKELWNAL